MPYNKMSIVTMAIHGPLLSPPPRFRKKFRPYSAESFGYISIPIGQKLRKGTKVYSAQKKQRFDNFIMLVWVQGSPFHIAAGAHPVQEAWGSQDSLYRGQIQKLLQCCQELYHQIPLVITIQKKYSLTYL